MSLISLKPQESDEQAPPAKRARSLLTWLKSWELYIILLLAILFRFYLLGIKNRFLGRRVKFLGLFGGRGL